MARSNGIIGIGAAFCALAMLGTAAAAPARQPPRPGDCAQAGDATPQTKSAPERWRYCITMEITGSRVSKRICRTMAEWKAAGVDPFNL